MPKAVIFDLDGVLLDSEQLWNQVKRDLVIDSGGTWREEAPHEMMGMSSPEWSAYMRSDLGLPMEEAEINAEVVYRMEAAYRRELPLLPGAIEAVERVVARWPVAIASSSNREIIDTFVELAGLAGAFAATISSEEVDRGKPAPDVFLRAASELGASGEACIAVEDSGNGLAAAAAAGMTVVAIPNPHYPPAADRLELAAVTIAGLDELTAELIERTG